MADDKTLNEDDDIEIVEVDKLPTPAEIEARDAAAADGKADGDDDEHDDDEDTRLAEREDEGGDEKARKTRKARRQAQKDARDRTLAQVDSLTRQNAELLQRLTAVEGHTVGITEREIGSKLADAKRRLADFDAILATAVETGDGAGYVAALSQRDTARDEARALEDTAQRIEQAKKTPPATKPNPIVDNFANRWKEANSSWYGKRGYEEDTAIANAIDNRLTAERYDPASSEYWEELTRRMEKRLGTAKADDEDKGQRERPNMNARKGPPVGGDRSAGSPGNRREVYVTPERKQAMQEAGIWDDPVKRAKMLKSYRDYDAQAAR